MAIDDADQSDAGEYSDGEASDPESEDNRSHESATGAVSGGGARVDEYTWEEFMNEYGYGDEVSVLYPDEPVGTGGDDQLGLDTDEGPDRIVPAGDDWDHVEFDPASYLGFHPDELRMDVLSTAGDNADELQEIFLEYVDPETTPVVKDEWTWEHYKWAYYYEDDGSRPRDSDGDIVRHDTEEALGFDPDTLEQRLFAGDEAAMELDELVEERTVNVQDELEEDEFFSTVEGNTTVSNRYDLEKAVPMEKKTHFREIERYWVNKPYAYVVIFHSEKENEKKYYMVEPYLNEIELELQEFLAGKLRTAIKYSDEGIKEKASEDGRRSVIEEQARRLLERYDLFEKTSGSTQESILETVQNLLDDDADDAEEDAGPAPLQGLSVRPEPAILADDPDVLNEYQVEKLLYLLKRNFIGYERIDGIKHDINVEDISVNGYNSPVFVYHSEYEQIISNIYHGEDELDDFVVKLAQRSGKGISKRLPQVDATLPDGSRAQLTLGQEVSDHGTNYTIRQFKDVPFTPIDLINWNTFSLDEMAFLWLCIENHKSLIFAGGTASGKTTSLNAVSLFIPSSAKIVSIEDTREVELPQRNWIASITRPSFADDEQGDVDEFDLLEAALRQRPDYIVMGEIRGEEGRTLFQVMSTGHTTYTTFHADSVDEVLKRFTTDPINVSKTMFTALDLVSIQTQTRVQGRKVRRNKSLTEINHYEAEHDEINVQDVYQWQAETDEYLKMGDSNTLDEIQFDRGWSMEKLEEELFKREVIIAYLIKNGLNTYAEVAATVQAFINDPDTILTLIANGQLEDSLEDLREMESVLIDVDPEKEELVPRPDASDETYNLSMDLLERAEESLFEEYRGKVPSGLASSLGESTEEEPIEVDRADAAEFDFAGDVDDSVEEDDWELGDGSTAFGGDSGEDVEEPAWLSDDTGFDIGTDDTGDDAGTAATADAATDNRDAGGAGAAETASSADRTETTGGFDMAAGEPADADGTPATPTSSGTESTQSSTADGESTVFPSEDSEDSDLGGLFDDMGDTIDELEEATEPGGEARKETAETSPDSSGFDSMFADDELDSIFDPNSDDESKGDFSGQFETEADDATTAESEESSAEPEPIPSDDGSTPSSERSAPEPPTIDLGESAGESTAESAEAESPAEPSAASESPAEADEPARTDDSDGEDSSAEPTADADDSSQSSSVVGDHREETTADDSGSIVADEPIAESAEADAVEADSPASEATETETTADETSLETETTAEKTPFEPPAAEPADDASPEPGTETDSVDQPALGAGEDTGGETDDGSTAATTDPPEPTGEDGELETDTGQAAADDSDEPSGQAFEMTADGEDESESESEPELDSDSEPESGSIFGSDEGSIFSDDGDDADADDGSLFDSDPDDADTGSSIFKSDNETPSEADADDEVEHDDSNEDTDS